MKRLLQRFSGRATVRRVALNSTWLAADNVFRLVVSFVVGAWVARHLGPEQFGLLNYAVAFCAPFGALVGLGLNGIVVRELVRSPAAGGELLGTTLTLKAAAGVVSAGVCLAAFTAAPELDARVRWLVVVTMAGTAIQAVDVFDLWFQGQGQARVSAWVRSVASIVINAGRMVMILMDAPLVWFAAAAGLELVLCAIGWCWFLGRSTTVGRWCVSRSAAWRLLREGWPVAVAGVAVQVQAYADQLLLTSLRGPVEVGHYAAALRLISVFSFLPMAVSTAAAPEITRALQDDRERYLKRLTGLYRVMLLAFLGVWLPLVLLAGPIVYVLFGDAYAATAALIPLLAWRLLLTNLGVVRGIFLTNERLLMHGMITALIGAAVNVGLNLFLIPVWGATGCIVASLVSFTVTTVGLEWIEPRARVNLRMMVSAVTFRRVAP